MAWGAPDHTQKIELEYMRYRDVYLAPDAFQPIIALNVPVIIIDQDMIGNFGRVRIESRVGNIYLRVTIDGQMIFNYNADNLLTIGCYGINSGFDKYGVTRYDDNLHRYDFFYDEHWGIWIKNRLTVDVVQTVGALSTVTWNLYYKERYET